MNYYHKYIPNVALILEPLHNLLRKGVEFNWSKECEEAFRALNDYLIKEPILAIFDPNKTSYVITDASDLGYAATLKQIQEDGNLHPIGYFSMKSSKVKKRRDAIYIELTAIRKAIEFWHHYLYGVKFVVVTDHKPLKNLKLKTRPDTKIGQQLIYLDQYNFKVIYQEGKNNIEANELSRSPVLEYFEGEETVKHANIIELKEIRNDQKNLDEKKLKKDYFIKNDDIWFKIKDNRKRVVISKEIGLNIVKKLHTSLGHIGRGQLSETIRKRFYFKGMNRIINKYWDKCEVCIKNKKRKRKIGYLSCLGPANRPFEYMSIDTVGGFSGKNSIKKYLHILIDHFSRFVWIRSSKTQNANDFIKLIDKIADKKEIKNILVDQYSGINSDKFKNYLKANEINMLITPVDNPESNGMNERVNQTITNKIRCELNNERNKDKAWTTSAERAIKMYNDTEHSVTKYSPAFLLTGIQKRISPLKETLDLEKARKQALKNTKTAMKRNKERIDSKRIDREIKIGEKVYVESENKLNRSKLSEIRKGLVNVLDIKSPLIYKLDLNRKKEENNLVHKNRLIPCVGR